MHVMSVTVVSYLLGVDLVRNSTCVGCKVVSGPIVLRTLIQLYKDLLKLTYCVIYS